METQADGSSLAYEYDLNGNKTGLVVTPVDAAAIITSYSYDLVVHGREGDSSFYDYDDLRSTRLLSHAAGEFTDTYDDEAFGEVLNRTGVT